MPNIVTSTDVDVFLRSLNAAEMVVNLDLNNNFFDLLPASNQGGLWRHSTGVLVSGDYDPVVLDFDSITTALGYVPVNKAGDTGIGSLSLIGNLACKPASTAGVGLIVTGLSSQTGNLQEWRNSSNTILGSFDPNGKFNVSNEIRADNSVNAEYLLRLGSLGAVSWSTGNTWLSTTVDDLKLVRNSAGLLHVRGDNGAEFKNLANSAYTPIRVSALNIGAGQEGCSIYTSGLTGYTAIATYLNEAIKIKNSDAASADSLALQRNTTITGTTTVGGTTGLVKLNNSTSGAVWQLRAEYGDLNIEPASGTTNGVAIRASSGYSIVQNVAGSNIATVNASGLSVTGSGTFSSSITSNSGNITTNGSVIPVNPVSALGSPSNAWQHLYQRGDYLNYNNSYSGTTNYERGYQRWNSNVYEIGTENGGTGVARDLKLIRGGTTALTIGASSAATFPGDVTTNRLWCGDLRGPSGGDIFVNSRFVFVTGVASDTLPTIDNAYYLGSSGKRWKGLSVGGHVTQGWQSSASDPTTSDIPSGSSRMWKNTTTGEIRTWANDGGVMKKSAALT